MSSGYTSALATTAPAAPATAEPHGGNIASFDCTAIMWRGIGFCVYKDGFQAQRLARVRSK